MGAKITSGLGQKGKKNNWVSLASLLMGSFLETLKNADILELLMVLGNADLVIRAPDFLTDAFLTDASLLCWHKSSCDLFGVFILSNSEGVWY
jgi:hypothetical protein